MSQLSLRPAVIEIASTETIPLQFNFSAQLGVGETVSVVSCILTNLSTKRVYTAGLSGVPVVASPVVTQTITALEAGQSYRLAITFTAAAGKILTGEVTLVCQF